VRRTESMVREDTLAPGAPGVALVLSRFIGPPARCGGRPAGHWTWIRSRIMEASVMTPPDGRGSSGMLPPGLTVVAYHRMIEQGLLGEDDPVQLLEGELVTMTPQGVPHGFVIQELTRLLVRAVDDRLAVRPQLPLTLGDDSEPEPDLAVVPASEARGIGKHPGTALLVVEVAGESLRQDRDRKGAIYARAGIPEYWIVDLDALRVIVLRDPDIAARSYASESTFGPGEEIVAASVPGVRLAVATLFPGRAPEDPGR
jgi:Uma2 family endonuclease